MLTRGLKEQIETSSNKKVDPEPPVEFISTGSINLNLALSQKGLDGGWARGRIINIVGDGSSGKTMIALEACAYVFYHLSKNATKLFPAIKKLIIVYNNVEGVMDFPIELMYGKEFKDAVEWIQTPTCQAFGRDVQRRLNNLQEGEFLLYVCDSIDATISEEEQARIEKSIKEDKAQEGSYKTEKAKYFSSAFFNDLCGRMVNKDATIICISQVRENLNAGVFGKKYYRTGGKALDFYTHQVVWLYLKEKIKKIKNKQERVIGTRVLAKVDRNKTAKPYREAEFQILFDYGLDNIGSMVSNYFGPKVRKISFEDYVDVPREEFINSLEEDDETYNMLINKVVTEWQEVEELVKVKRKPRFIKE